VDVAFWDTSALVPLCVVQAISHRAVKLANHHEIVVWWATPVEIVSAISRLARMNQIDAQGVAKANHRASQLASDWFVIKPSDPLRVRAVRLLNQHSLRAGDALQLSAALEWCNDQPNGRVFLTADQRLRQAASLCGFDAKTV
jgi:predicted nucleic acid-binding protein